MPLIGPPPNAPAAPTAAAGRGAGGGGGRRGEGGGGACVAGGVVGEAPGGRGQVRAVGTRHGRAGRERLRRRRRQVGDRGRQIADGRGGGRRRGVCGRGVLGGPPGGRG